MGDLWTGSLADFIKVSSSLSAHSNNWRNSGGSFLGSCLVWAFKTYTITVHLDSWNWRTADGQVAARHSQICCILSHCICWGGGAFFVTVNSALWYLWGTREEIHCQCASLLVSFRWRIQNKLSFSCQSSEKCDFRASRTAVIAQQLRNTSTQTNVINCKD